MTEWRSLTGVAIEYHAERSRLSVTLPCRVLLWWTLAVHGPLDIMVTLVGFAYESNPIVTALGLHRWVVLKTGLLIGLYGAYRLASGHWLTPWLLLAGLALGVPHVALNAWVLVWGIVGGGPA